MKKAVMMFVTVWLSMVLLPSGHAQTAVEDQWSISIEGPLVYTLPEEPAINASKEYTEYIITWEPLDNIHAYYIGITQEVETADDLTLYMMADGFLGNGKVLDGQGKEYRVPFTIFDSIKLDGDARQVNLASIINAFDTSNEYHPTRYYVIVMMVPESGEPVRQLIEIPIGLE